VTFLPTSAPTSTPLSAPSQVPIPAPSAEPTTAFTPTAPPTSTPLSAPSQVPIPAPSAEPTTAFTPTAPPTLTPTAVSTTTRTVCFEMILEDSFGDGWNGAVYSISNLEGLVANGTMDVGSRQIDEICLPNAACYDLVVTAGSHHEEVNWTIASLTGGAPAQVSFYVAADDLLEGECSHPPTTTAVPTVSHYPTAYPTAVPTALPTATLVPTSDTACFDLFLRDSFGDGWDGAVYTISNSTAVVATGTMLNGDTQTDEVCLRTASCYTIRITEGEFPAEIGWSLLPLFGGAPAQVSFYATPFGAIHEGECTAPPTATPSSVISQTTMPPSFAPTERILSDMPTGSSMPRPSASFSPTS